MDAHARAQQVVRRCRELATISEERDRLTRRYATPAMAQANARVGGWMRDAGLQVRGDAAGNLIGRRAGTDPAAGTLLLGSHLDTVRDAGAFDGPLGVLGAISVVERLHAEERELPFAIDVLGFADEEGLRYGTAYLGSRAVAGTFDPALLDLRDPDGISLKRALRDFGGAPDAIDGAARRGERLLGYCELHIEQGPVLEELGAPVGVVTGIAGATRLALRFRGRPGHAGTVPMRSRHDALAAAAEWVGAVEQAGRSVPGLVATVGVLEAQPGAPNVIPGSVTATLDARHAEDAVREEAVVELIEAARAAGDSRGVEVGTRTTHEAPAVAMDEQLTAVLSRAAVDAGLPDVRVPSGAGHDAVALAERCPVAMLFVRCPGGLSHHPGESVAADDVAVALEVLDGFVRQLADGA